MAYIEHLITLLCGNFRKSGIFKTRRNKSDYNNYCGNKFHIVRSDFNKSICCKAYSENKSDYNSVNNRTDYNARKAVEIGPFAEQNFAYHIRLRKTRFVSFLLR